MDNINLDTNRRLIMNLVSKLHSRLVVEAGMGDGSLLRKLACNDSDINARYIGIEIDNVKYSRAVKENHDSRILYCRGAMEDLILIFPDKSIDIFLIILPDPRFIDRNKADIWTPFYRAVFEKLKIAGYLRLVTEITDDLLNPVSDEIFNEWVSWLCTVFLSLGFKLENTFEGTPDYDSDCLALFRKDPNRIRIITMDMKRID